MRALRVPYPVVQVAIVEGWRGCSVEIQEGSEEITGQKSPSTESVKLGVWNSVSLAKAVSGPDCAVEPIVTVNMSAFHLG